MKKTILAGILLLSLTVVKAQIFNPFKVDISAGYAVQSGQGSSGGALFAIEPKYAIIDRFAVGLRMEAAVTARGFVANDGSSASANVAASASYLLTYDYYFTNFIVRPFVGGGTGVFEMASASFSGDEQGDATVAAGSSSKVGTMVRSGFEFHHFRFAAEYNFIGKTTETLTDNQGNVIGTVTAKNSYAGIKIGFFIGGGRRK
jgi:outer membrane protein X